MAKINQHKVVASLPDPLEANSIYYVRVGAGFDQYVTNGSGTIVAYQSNAKLELEGKVDKEEGKVLSSNDYTTAEKNKLASLENFDDSAIQAELATKVDKVAGKGLSDENYTLAEKNKLGGIEAGAQVNSVTSVAGKTGAVTLVKADVGLGNVDNTSDANKPISTATATALNGKVDKVSGKQLSTEDYTTAEKTKLSGIQAGAQVNVATNIGQGSRTSTTIPLTSSTGTGTTLPSATTSFAGLQSAADKAKLDGIAADATANATDAQLRDRATHTGVQPITSVEGLQDALDDKVDNTDSRMTNSREWTASVVTQAEAEAGTSTTARKWTAQRVRQAILGWWNTSTFKTKLDGIESGATKNATDAQLRDRSTHTGTQPISSVTNLQSSLDSKVDKVAGYGLSQENYTPAEKSKLASIEGSKFKGEYVSLAALQAAHPSPEVGSYAYVDAGVGEVVSKYIWDSSDAEWVKQQGETAALTPAEIKTLYEENPDTNAFTDSEKTKLSGIQAGATANATNAQLRDRSTHTGTQPISSVSGLQDALDGKQPVGNYVTDTDPRLSDSREWTATVVSQAEAQAGTSTTERKWTAQRVAQAISALGLKIGTTASTAKAGNWTPTWSEVSGKPTTFTPESHTHSLSEVTDAGDLAAINTNASTTNFLRGDGTWATPPNTTYSEITTAEIDAGTASTSRTISGRRMKYALDKKADAVHGHSISDVSGLQTELENKADTSYVNTQLDTKVDKTVSVVAGTGLSGGGTLVENRTLSVTYGTTAGTAAQGNDTRIVNATPNSRQIIAGTGLTGGGNLTADRTLSVTYGTAAGTAAQGNDSRLSDSREWTATTVSQAEAEAGTATTRRAWTAQRVRQAILGWWNSSAEKTKLDGIATGATKNATDAQLRDRSTHTGTQAISTVSGLQTALDAKVDKVTGMGLSQENFTTAEKNKLASLESSKFKGQFSSFAALQSAFPTADVGSYAYVDQGAGQDVVKYIWDSSDTKWVLQQGESAALTPSDVKNLYESNADTNAFTNSEKSKLSGIESGAQVNVGTNLAMGGSGNSRTITSSTGNNVSVPVATTSAAGFMSTTDKSKLDGLNNVNLVAGSNVSLSGTYPNITISSTNTTYSEISEAEVTTGTASTARAISARRLKFAIDTHGLQIGTTSTTAKAGNWTPAWGDVSGKPTTFTPSAHTHTLSEITDAGSVAALNTTGSTTVFLRGDGTWATPTNTTYAEITTAEIDAGTASTLRTITGRRMKYALDKKADVSHTHTLSQITDAGNVAALNTNSSTTNFLRGDGTWSTPPNTTYSEISEAEVTAGTASTARAISARRLKFAVDTHGLKIGTTSTTAKAGNWTPTWSEVSGKPTTFAPSAHTHSLSQITDAGTVAALSTNGSTANFLRGDGTWVTPPNTTYAEITTAEIDAGTASTARAISGRRMKYALDKKADVSHTHTLSQITDAGNVAGINTNGSTANYLRGDGTWVTPPNTTYSTMSVAEGKAGTATSARTMRADYLKQIIESHVEVIDGGSY